ncbi:hook-related protein family, partial [Endogone sp. FLAS-F59071]
MKKLTPMEENMAVAFVNSFDNISHTANITDLSDGIVLFEVLAEIDPKWFKLIRSADVGDNWVLKFNNLKKLYKLVTRFYEEILGQSTDNLLAPNLNAIAKESDVVETLKLCQMVIALAVQCENNQIYIEKIQTLSPALQHALMLSIEQVMTRINGGDVQQQASPPSHPSRQTSFSSEDDRLYKRVEQEHARIIAEKEELEKAHNELIEEHAQLRYRFDELESERLDLRARLREMEHAVEQANQTGNNNYIMRAEIEHLKQDLERSEDRRQETERLVDEQMQRISELNRKVDDLTRRAQEADRLKDQLDEYKHTAEKLQKTENVMEKYKKKMEEI